MESKLDHATARALLEMQIEMGADEAISEAPVDRFGLAPRPGATARPPDPKNPPPPPEPAEDPAEVARKLAAAAQSLPELAHSIASFEGCELKRGARNTVFADGNPAARVMIIGEAPGREEDQQGRPFVGPAGQLLDKMLAAIGMGRDAADAANSVYITNVVPWRPPQNREPTPEEIGMLMPFVERHVELAQPEFLVLMGNIACQALLGRKGITRLRGKWATALGLPALPMFHPAYLLRNPAAKKEAWHDLLMLQDRLRQSP